ncbi:MAG: TonB-dependent receptor [Gemmatimonadaceae bacterium]|jgi:hypothetical protein|nr:TonB-dependent receptor [Gemmatimonadaceae bacterium]
MTPLFLRLLLVPCLAAPLLAQPARTVRDTTRTDTLHTIRVEGRRDDLTRIARSASQGYVGRRDLQSRPLTREGEVLEAVPGVILTQHSGDGKANQIFLRGFNLDHGTDFNVSLEGMPLNMPTHGHGQGYMDLNFLTPEFVDHVEYTLGNYYAETGDFGAAGAARLSLVRDLATPLVRIESGAFGFHRGVLGASVTRGRSTWLIGGEAKGYDGPWQLKQQLGKGSGLARWSWRGAHDDISVLGMAYVNDWRASDQIPQRAVDERLISRFGQVDSTLGGTMRRASLSATWTHQRGSTGWHVTGYGVRQRFGLFSNFTYFLDNTGAGDQFRQSDERTIAGASAEWRRFVTTGRVSHTLRVGSQLRVDDIDNGLFRSERRVVTDTVRADAVAQQSAAAYTSLETRWTPQLRSVLGVRGDAYRFDVTSNNSRNSGRRSQALAQPKVTLAYAPSDRLETYLSAGLGFHSNDARGTVIRVDPVSGDAADRVDPLVRSRGAELGMRLSPTPTWRSTLALWTLRLDSELLFVGDAGTTEPQGASRRTGVTLANFWRTTPSLTLDADVSLTRARFADLPRGANFVPGALPDVIAAGVTWEPPRGRFFGAVRLRHFGRMPLIEDNSVRGRATTLGNASLGWRAGQARVMLSLLNVLDSRASDIQYFYASRLGGEPSDGVNDIHFHPAEPRQVRVSVSYGW